MMKDKARKIILYFQFIFPLIFFYFLYKYTHFDTYKILQHIKISVLPPIFFIYFISAFILSLNASMLARCFGIFLSAWRMLFLNFMSIFYNLVFPGQLGGMLYRWFRIGAKDDKEAEAIFYIATERFIEIFTALLIAFVALIFYNPLNNILFWGTASLFALFIFIALFSKRILKYFKMLLKDKRIWISNKILELIGKLSEGFRRVSIALFVKLVIIFVLHRILASIGYLIIFRSVGIYYPFWGIIWLSIMIYLCGLIPLSFMNIGIREGFLIYFLGKQGASVEVCLAVSAYSIFFIIFGAVIGGILECINLYIKKE